MISNVDSYMVYDYNRLKVSNFNDKENNENLQGWNCNKRTMISHSLKI